MDDNSFQHRLLISDELKKLAKEIVEQKLKEDPNGEDIVTWANRLAKDVSKLNDN